MSTFMKQHFFYLFLAMNLFLMACSSGDSEDSEQLDGVHFVEHHKDTYGGNRSERWNCNIFQMQIL